MMELFVKTLVKSLDIPAMMNDPRVAEIINLARGVAKDFQDIKAGQTEILKRLDKIEMENNVPPAVRAVGD
jgi:hypothetical protein